MAASPTVASATPLSCRVMACRSLCHASRSLRRFAKAASSFCLLVKKEASRAFRPVLRARTPTNTSRIFCLMPNFMSLPGPCRQRSAPAVSWRTALFGGDVGIDRAGGPSQFGLHVSAGDDGCDGRCERLADRAVARDSRTRESVAEEELLREHFQGAVAAVEFGPRQCRLA